MDYSHNLQIMGVVLHYGLDYDHNLQIIGVVMHSG